MSGAERWRARATTLEAMVLLLAARALVAGVRFARWRATLGSPLSPGTADPAPGRDGNLEPRRLARAIERAAARLPGESKCLPRAMALQWLLRRRRLGGVLHLGVRSAAERGTLDDLHAWVTRGGEVLVGASEATHRPVYAAANPDGEGRR